MTREAFIRALRRAGMDEAEVQYYAEAYPPEDWEDLVSWAQHRPDLDACDDIEADIYHA